MHWQQQLELVLISITRSEKKLRIRFKGPEHPISRLGDDLVGEILIRLPNPRSASRCKPVCKRWNSMISNPSFNRRFVSHHQSRNREPPLLLPSDDPLSSSILSFLPVPGEIRSEFVIWDSFKDLLLCGFKDWGSDTDSQMGRLFLLCNPLTKQWVALPLAPERITRHYRTAEVRLVCKEVRNSKKSLELGDGQVFMYSSDYRFLVLLEYRTYLTMISRCETYVFCSKSRKWSWRNNCRLQPDAASLNGKLYWKYDQKICRSIPFRGRDMPPTTVDAMKFMEFCSHFSASNGALYIIQLQPDTVSEPDRRLPPTDGYGCRVWKWGKGSRKWTICHEASVMALKGNSGSEVKDLEIFGWCSNPLASQHQFLDMKNY
ncbi:unnamed protein product [Linum tenue]|uniref:F-box domain-containing protein n=1 Tax=Linum tenue TaxID=586396 RepID=A0AAV0IU11_9ROSI|nr:unnamed protein product [Linum tenue]